LRPSLAPKALGSAETVLFQDSLVTVTTTRVIVRGEVTYAMANLTSVRAFVQKKPLAVLFGGLLLIVLGACCIGARVAHSRSMGIIVTSVGIALVIAYLYLFKAKYWVRIGTAGAETNAIWSDDPTWTRGVVEAVNQAIVARR
jgi:hypothetical protein